MNLKPDVAYAPARILIVDDDSHNRGLLEVMLESEGFVLVTATTGQEALDIVAKQPPDLVLLDIMMPGIDGYQVAAKIKNGLGTKNIPVIMVTALDDRNARMTGLSVGAEDFLTRPVDRAELCARVRNLLRLRAYGDYYDKYSQLLEDEVTSRTADLVERTRTLEQQAIELRLVTGRLSLATSIARVGVWEWDLASNTLAWDATMFAIYGLPAAVQIPYAKWSSAVYPGDLPAVEATLRRTIAERGQGSAEYRINRPDGSVRNVSAVHRVVIDGSANVGRLIGVDMDVTERKEAADRLRQSQKMEAIGGLAGGIAHDFNNLLTAILGFSEMALGRLDDKKNLKGDIVEIQRAGERAAALTRQLLIFSRQQVLQPQPVDLNALVTELGKMLRRLIGEDIDLTLSCGEPAATILADPGQIEQVIINLAVNARDAMPMGGQLVIETSNVDVDVIFAGMRHGLKPGSYVMLAVTDDGVGMDAATQARLFEPFFTTKEVGKGTGLGLATVYGIVKQCEGDIHIYSEPGEGTTFKILFPRVAESIDEPRAAVAMAEYKCHGTETILVVEDEEAVRSLIRSALSLCGYVVHEARDGPEALEVQAAIAGPIHLIICDMVMPMMNGPEVVRRLGSPRPEAKVLFMSGYAEKALLRRGLSQTSAFLHKPFGMETLAWKVREVLDVPVPDAVLIR